MNKLEKGISKKIDKLLEGNRNDEQINSFHFGWHNIIDNDCRTISAIETLVLEHRDFLDKNQDIYALINNYWRNITIEEVISSA